MNRKSLFTTIAISLVLILFTLFIVNSKKQKKNNSDLIINPENKNLEYPKITQKEDITNWKTFKNNHGWSIKYPPDWHIGGSHYQSLKDLIESSAGFWGFYPPDDTPWQEGWLMVSRLSDKPANQSLESWYKNIASRAVIPPKTMEENIIFNGQPGYRTVWRACSSENICEGSWQEDVYVVYNSQTFQIGFNTDRLHKNLENYRNYRTYQQILSTFKFLDQTSKTDTLNWKTYNNSDFGFSFKYPQDYPSPIEETISTNSTPFYRSIVFGSFLTIRARDDRYSSPSTLASLGPITSNPFAEDISTSNYKAFKVETQTNITVWISQNLNSVKIVEFNYSPISNSTVNQILSTVKFTN